MAKREVKITPRTGAKMRALKVLAPLAPIAMLWLLFLTELMSAVFAEQVFYGSRSTPLHWVTYREEPTLFVFVFVISLAGVGFLGRVLLGLIPKTV